MAGVVSRDGSESLSSDELSQVSGYYITFHHGTTAGSSTEQYTDDERRNGHGFNLKVACKKIVYFAHNLIIEPLFMKSYIP